MYTLEERNNTGTLRRVETCDLGGNVSRTGPTRDDHCLAKNEITEEDLANSNIGETTSER